MNAPLMAAVGEINMNRKWNPEPPGLFKNLSNETHSTAGPYLWNLFSIGINFMQAIYL